MTDRESFIRGICDDPADDTIRLVFADWLEEHGEPEFAEFVRAQVALANPDPTAVLGWFFGDTTRDDLRRRSLELWNWHWTEWAPFADRHGCSRVTMSECVARVGPFDFRPCRGFIEEVHASWRAWLDLAPAILAAHPLRRITTEYVDGLALRILDPSMHNRCWGIAADLPGYPSAWYGMRDRAELLETVVDRSNDLAVEMIRRRDRRPAGVTA